MKARRWTSKPVTTPAKIAVPRLAETYPRSRLFRALDAARRKRVVWLAAPAGAGKTSVVATYLSTRRVPALWYNVDARDADVANLFHYLTLAARAAAPRKKLDLPAFSAENQFGVAAFARGFFEALCRERPVPSFIVLDDYQEAAGALWEDVIREAISALPKGIVAVIISRAEPPPAFARHVASGEIALVGWDELRLTPLETTGLVRLRRPDWRGRQLSDVLPCIVALTNGWAAALTLLLQNQQLGTLDARGLEASSERLFDYFATEILDKATVAQRDFLLRTSVVPSLTTAIATRLTGAPDAARILTDLGRRSFLTQRLGASGAYRYHPLLRGFLRRRAERDLGAATLHDLHRKAADCFVETDLIDEAMEQLETAQDVPMRVKLLLRVAPSYFAKGGGRTVEAWIARLPEEVVEQDGWLLFWRALCCLGHSPSEARELLEAVFARFTEEKDAGGLYRCCATATQAILHEGMNFLQLDAWMSRFQQLEASGLPCPPEVEPTTVTGMLMASMFGPADAAVHRDWADRARQVTARCKDGGQRVMIGGYLAVYFVFHDSPAQAATILQMMRASASTKSSAVASLTLLQADALCAWARGETEACISLVRQALALAESTGIPAWNDYLLGLGAAATLASEDLDAAREFLQGLAQAAERGANYPVGSFHFYASWEAFLRGDIARALHSAELAYSFSDALGYRFARALSAVGLALLHWQAGQGQQARAMMELARRLTEEGRSVLLLYSCELIEADALWDEERPRALAALERGLALGRERGYFNGFWVSNTMVARLATRALEHQIEPEYTRTMIVKRRLTPASVPASMDAWHWSYRLRALGPFELWRASDGEKPSTDEADRGNGRGAPPGRGAPRGMPLRLLQATLALGGRGVPDVQLIDALWPDAEGDGGRRVFDTTLHRLRKQLGDDAVLRLIDGRLHLDERLCWVDIWAFEETIAKVKGAVEGAVTTELTALSRRLLDLYRGPLLADGPAANTFLRGPRSKLAAKFLHAAETIGKALENKGHFADACELYQRALEGEQGVELAYAGLIRCALGEGRRADGLQLFEQCRTRLLSDLGEEPGTELSRLRARLSEPSGRP
ncbi:MAG TPA: BTAD domain-containing putative transcriptional regulator [Polyangiaceae bacterium]|nr:BTAD domain-containing putative transcriptional regulator [Polyangiaceae bacterium]